jgi:hypothetical protein
MTVLDPFAPPFPTILHRYFVLIANVVVPVILAVVAVVKQSLFPEELMILTSQASVSAVAVRLSIIV